MRFLISAFFEQCVFRSVVAALENIKLCFVFSSEPFGVAVESISGCQLKADNTKRKKKKNPFFPLKHFIS
jgi:hypothetical protein